MSDADAFAVLEDPLAIARAQKASETAWSYVEAGFSEAERPLQRRRMVYVVVPLALEDNDDPTGLAHRAIRRFQERPFRRP